MHPSALLFARLKETKASPRGEVDAYADGEVYVFVWIAYGSAFCNRNDLYHLSGGYTASSPQGEPLSIIVLKNGSSGVPTPTGKIEVFVFETYGCAFCNRNDIGGSKPPPYRQI